MSANSKIEWTDHTFNPWIGCTKVSPACDHCYAERSTPSRTLKVAWGAGQPRRRTTLSNWMTPFRWNDQANAFMAQHGRRQRVFCASLADVFDNEVPDEWRADLFDLIDATPNLDWLLLTKRIGNVRDMMRRILRPGTLPPHVWLGATICNQPEADRDITKLLAVDARVRFLSMEPLLGPVDLGKAGGVRIELGVNDAIKKIINQREAYPSGDPDGQIDWVIVGGESGPQARPMHPDWARSLRDQCQAAGVPFMFKQWGEWAPADQAPIGAQRGGRTYESGAEMIHYGKKAAGRELDGRTWDEVPA